MGDAADPHALAHPPPGEPQAPGGRRGRGGGRDLLRGAAPTRGGGRGQRAHGMDRHPGPGLPCPGRGRLHLRPAGAGDHPRHEPGPCGRGARARRLGLPDVRGFAAGGAREPHRGRAQHPGRLPHLGPPGLPGSAVAGGERGLGRRERLRAGPPGHPRLVDPQHRGRRRGWSAPGAVRLREGRGGRGAAPPRGRALPGRGQPQRGATLVPRARPVPAYPPVSPELLRDLVAIGFGALSGGLTNQVAIWMLFHPYEPPRLGRWKIGFFQGAVPKNQPRLAAAIGRTVGNRLLTAEDLTRTFARPEFRQAFDEKLGAFLDEVLQKERGSLRDLLPPVVMEEIEPVIEEAVGLIVARADEYVASEGFAEAMERRAGELVALVADQPIGNVLTDAREEALASAVEDWLEGAVESDDFRRAAEDYLDRGARRLLAPGRTFEEILPSGLVGAVEKAIASYLPLVIERLGKLLEDEAARARLEATVHDLLHRFLRDLKFHQRVVARLVMTEDTVDRVLDTIEREGADRLSEALRDPAVQNAMARGVNEAIVDFLRRPVTSVLGEPDDPSVLEARGTVLAWAMGMARDPANRDFVVEKLRGAMDKAGDRTWGEVLERIPPERLASWVVASARSDTAGRAYREGAQRLASKLLDRPIGTPAAWLPPGAPERIEAALANPLWDWLQAQVPEVVERLDVARRVEQKVLEFPTPKMEELVRKVTDRELKLIVRLGYVLGAMVGMVLVTVQHILS
ncbi:MAG: DUF445 family protein [Gemmatimonadetes bacterium]|nr:DUF445 family protein [Gemmatimonadota bacterium]